MINPGDTVLVGVSGGYDSIMLLDVLYRLREDMKFDLAVAHVNHSVRGDESDQDEEYVKKTAEKYGLKYFVKRVDMEDYARKNRITDEEAGRILRYGFFRDVLRELDSEEPVLNSPAKSYEKDRCSERNESESSLSGNKKIAVAHNKNDQAETILLRVMRGTGIDGLRGIEYVNGDIIRPILNISRDEIESYCEEHKLNPRLDSTNLETVYNRNKVRLELIPYIQENFNPNIIDTLFRLTENAIRDSEVLEKSVDAEYDKVIISIKSQKAVFNNEKLIKTDDNIKGRIIRKAIKDAFGNIVGIEEKHINDIILFSNNKSTGKSIDIAKNIRVKLEYDKLYIEKSENNSKVSYNYRIDKNKMTIALETGAVLTFEQIEKSSIEKQSDRNTEYFDYDCIGGEIAVRNRRDGDRVKLIGLSGTKKLKDFFIDQKVPKEKRDKVPLLVFGDDIAWIAGYRRSRLAKITEKTKKVLKVQYFEKTDIL